MDGRRSGHPDAGSVFDKIAECRERIERIENDAAPSTVVEREAQDVEDRIPERQEGEEQTRDDAHGWRD